MGYSGGNAGARYANNGISRALKRYPVVGFRALHYVFDLLWFCINPPRKETIAEKAAKARCVFTTYSMVACPICCALTIALLAVSSGRRMRLRPRCRLVVLV
jgi:hypothetical protein